MSKPHNDETNIKYSKYELLRSSFLVVLSIFSMLAAFLFWRELQDIRQWQMVVRESIPIDITENFRVDAAIHHQFPVRLDTKIPVNFPVSSVVQIPIRETFMIPLEKTFTVVLNTPLRLKDTIRVSTNLPLDIMVETKVLGIPMTIPVKGVIPLNLDLPVDQDINVLGEVLVNLKNPLPVEIDHVVEAPLDFMVEGIMPLDTTIQAPVEGTLDCTIRAQEPLQVDIELAVSVEDVLAGVCLFP